MRDRQLRLTAGALQAELRVVGAPLPGGYVAYAGGQAVSDPLGPTLRRGGTVVWMVPGDDGQLRCEDWRASAKEVRDDGVSGELRRGTTTAGPRELFTLDIAVGPRQGAAPSLVSLEGPSCGMTYSVVAADATRVTLVRGAYLDGLAGYHPDDTEVWYRSPAACEAARRRCISDPLAASGWVHRTRC